MNQFYSENLYSTLLKKRKALENIVLLSLSLILLNVSTAKATIVIIQATGTSSANEAFIPAVANAVCGDTIKWVNVSGTHTTASTTIPTGAASWNSPTLTPLGYTYVVTVAGTYEYTCHPASGGHMDASIIVTCSTGLLSVPVVSAAAVYPNPTSGKIKISLGEAGSGSLEIFNLAGKQVYQSLINDHLTETNLKLSDGVYYFELRSTDALLRKGELVIQH